MGKATQMFGREGSMIVSQLIALAAARYPDTEAIVEGSVRLTYRTWQGRISRVARALHARGIRKGDHIVFLLKNKPDSNRVFYLF